MSAVAQSLGILHAPSTPWAWLRRELAPSEERRNATIRLVVSVVTVVVLSMALQTPLTAFSAYMAFFISKENRVITTITGVLGCVGATIAIGGSIFIYRYTFDYPEYRIPAMAAAVFIGMWLSRVLTLGPIGFVVGFLVGLTQSISDGIPTADGLVRQLLWLWVVVNLGFGVTVIVNIVLLPADPLMALEKGLKQRLDLTIAALRRMIGSNIVGGDADGVLVDLASRGSASLEENLKLAALRQSVRTRRGALAAAIRESDRLLIAAANLGLRDPAPLSAPDRIAADSVVSTLTALKRRPLDPDAAGDVVADLAPTLLELREMQRTSLALRNALTAHDDASEAGSKQRPPLFRPDAFSNKDHVRFALKVTLAAMTCYVIYMGVDWPGIRTAFITCCFVALESTGATTRKAMLRLAGCAVGGALGFLSIVFLIPHMESIVSLALLTAAGSALAAWIAAGSERVSYAGLQVALAFFLCIYQGFAPDTDFDKIRDRVVGIVLGIIVSSTVFRLLWPERALVKMRFALARTLRGLARLVLIPTTLAPPEAESATAAKLRDEVPGNLNGLLRLSEVAALETTEPWAKSLSPEKGRRVTEAAQEMYLTAAILASASGLDDWSRLDDAARSAELASRGAASEQLNRMADAAESGRLSESLAGAAKRVPLPDTAKGERLDLVRRLLEQTDRAAGLASDRRQLDPV